MISLALLTGVVFCLNGCASYPDRSVAAIPGCGLSVIIIYNKKSGILSETWRATCKGKIIRLYPRRIRSGGLFG